MSGKARYVLKTRLEQQFLQCSKCREHKTRLKFPKNRASPTGYGNWCKQCHKESLDSKKQVTLEDAKLFYQNLIDIGTKFQCRKCDKIDTADKFYFKRSNGKVGIVESQCRECNSYSSKMQRFSMTKEEFLALLASQDNKCKICKIDHEEWRSANNGKMFAIDHCHTHGHIRGLLCSWCNKGLGHFKDNTTLLQTAIEYLRHNDIVSTSSES